MRTSRTPLLAWIGSFLVLLAGGEAAEQPLTHLQFDFDIVGVKLSVDPPALTVPKDIPTFVNAS